MKKLREKIKEYKSRLEQDNDNEELMTERAFWAEQFAVLSEEIEKKEMVLLTAGELRSSVEMETKLNLIRDIVMADGWGYGISPEGKKAICVILGITDEQ